MKSKPKEVKKDLLASRIIKKLNQLKKEGLDERSIERLNLIMKVFLKRRYKMGESLTTEEVVEQLEKKKIPKSLKMDLVHVLMQIHGLEYEQKDPVTDEEFSYVIALAIKTVQELSMGELTNISATLAKKSTPEGTMEKLQEQIGILGKKFKADWRDPHVREIYAQIKAYYDTLSDPEKKDVYPRIVKIFKIS